MRWIDREALRALLGAMGVQFEGRVVPSCAAVDTIVAGALAAEAEESELGAVPLNSGGERPYRSHCGVSAASGKGLGRDELSLDLGVLAPEAMLVTIAGANGGGNTVMDNLQPLADRANGRGSPQPSTKGQSCRSPSMIGWE